MKIIEMVIVTIDSLIYLSDISLLNKETVFSLHIAFKTKIKTIANVVTLIPPKKTKRRSSNKHKCH